MWHQHYQSFLSLPPVLYDVNGAWHPLAADTYIKTFPKTCYIQQTATASKHIQSYSAAKGNLFIVKWSTQIPQCSTGLLLDLHLRSCDKVMTRATELAFFTFWVATARLSPPNHIWFYLHSPARLSAKQDVILKTGRKYLHSALTQNSTRIFLKQGEWPILSLDTWAPFFLRHYKFWWLRSAYTAGKQIPGPMAFMLCVSATLKPINTLQWDYTLIKRMEPKKFQMHPAVQWQMWRTWYTINMTALHL